MHKIKQFLSARPWWMNLLFAFCAYMTFIYMPFDMFWKPVAQDQEVWFGILLTGWAAKATEPLHWAIYAAGFYGFWKMKPWMFPWAGLYVAQIAIGMLVWSVMDGRGGLASGIIAGGLFTLLAVALWVARDDFNGVADAGDAVGIGIANYGPTTCQPRANHLPTTCQPRTNYVPARR